LTALRANIVANFGGSLVAGLLGLVFVPVYVRLMGIEPYGLVGFFLTMQAVLVLLDVGMSTTLTVEFARLSAIGATAARMRRLLRTFEYIYWSVAVAAGAGLVLLARPIAHYWVQPRQLSIEAVTQAVMLMGIAFAVLWPQSLYGGGLQGLQRQVALNTVNTIAAVSRAGGAALLLWLVSPTIQTFFMWQAAVGVLHTVVTAIVLWRSIGGTDGAAFDPHLLRSVWRFAVGITFISVLSAVITQLDRIVLSRMLSLAAFGYYAVAATVAGSLYRLISPIQSAVFPRFAQLLADDDQEKLASLYHRSAEAVSLAVLPAAVFISFFSYEVMLLWTHDRATAIRTSATLSLLIFGTAFNGVMAIPYVLQLAYGWIRLVIVTNLAAVVVLIPSVILLTKRFGAPGAAFGWLAYNVLAAFIVPAVLHTRILRGEMARWYLRDVGAPLAVSLGLAYAARSLLVLPTAMLPLLLELGVIAVCMQAAAVLVVPEVRRRIFLRTAASVVAKMTLR
jgi:O-antigen/teichoic acid export membrane protein